MIRKLLIIGVPLLTPLATYLIWAWFTARRREALAAGRRLPSWQEWPWAWLAISGALLVAATLFAVDFVGERRTDADYRPARYEDGRLIPGEFRDAGEPTR